MVKIASQSNAPLPVNIFSKLWQKAKIMLILLAFLGLVSLNILTLVNDAIHAAAYGALKAILESAVPEKTLSRVLRNSPTAKRQKDVKAATKALSNQNAKLVASNNSLIRSHADLEKSNNEIKAKHAKLEIATGKQAAATKKFTKNLATRSLASATRNATSIAGEAIPFVGTAVILGVTAWDLNDACENMKDINELNVAFGHEAVDQTMVCGIKVPTEKQVEAMVIGNWEAAYRSAVTSVNKAGKALIPATPPKLSWADTKESICSVLGSIPAICP